MLDRTQRRIVGVLIEKELTVPDTYPLSEKALLAGCNQTSNRDPVFELQTFELTGALMALSEQGWVARVEGGSRVTKYRHKAVERLGVSGTEIAVLAELLLRGPQAPGALKQRVGRMGCQDDVGGLQRILAELHGRPQPLVEELSLAPRERHRRWRHLLGDDVEAVDSTRSEDSGLSFPPSGLGSESNMPDVGSRPAAVTSVPAQVKSDAAGADAALVLRVEELERKVAALQAELARLRSS